MKDLSITQEYLLCALNEKGKISGFSPEKIVCFIASGLLEMQLETCIEIDNKIINIINPLPKDLTYLNPLYDFINTSSPMKLEKLVQHYSFTGKDLNKLLASVGSSLEKTGVVETSKTGLLGDKKNYIPKKEAISTVIDKIRAELLEDVEITEDMAYLVILLEKSKTLNTYFSKFEQKELKEKISNITNSTTGKQVKDMVDQIVSLIVVIAAISG